MNPLKPAIVEDAQLERTVHDIALSFAEHPEHVCQMCGLPPGSPLGEILALAREQAHRERDETQIWMNDQYQVSVRRMQSDTKGEPDLVHLSIKRIDRDPIRDWRDMQAIKNQLVGPECEGVELYPAQSRLVDTSNQYHIWVIDDPAYRFPFGFGHGAVMPPTKGTTSKQRAL